MSLTLQGFRKLFADTCYEAFQTRFPVALDKSVRFCVNMTIQLLVFPGGWLTRSLVTSSVRVANSLVLTAIFTSSFLIYENRVGILITLLPPYSSCYLFHQFFIGTNSQWICHFQCIRLCLYPLNVVFDVGICLIETVSTPVFTDLREKSMAVRRFYRYEVYPSLPFGNRLWVYREEIRQLG